MKYRTGPEELERLCRLPDALENLKGLALDLREAQQRIQELEAENARLRAELEPRKSLAKKDLQP